MSGRAYVLVTPVKNEAATLGRTIASVVAQTHGPTEWVIVSDGSTDGTNEIAERAAAKYPWITLVAHSDKADRNFAAAVRNTERGIRSLSTREYTYIGFLDGDVEFQPDYFDELINRFEQRPNLGVAGGMVIDPGKSRSDVPRNRLEVPGAVQFFRRECLDRLGGLIPLPEGGWDVLTCAMARMYGYRTELVPDLIVDHLKPRSVHAGGVVRRHYELGLRDYAVGYDPLFEAVKCLGRLGSAPRFVGAIAHWCGYVRAVLSRRPRQVPLHVMEYLRGEQRQRLFRMWRRPKPAIQ